MRTDPVLFEILKNKFQSISEEMGFIIKRTATTIFVTETADFTTAMATPKGEFYGYPLRVGIVTFVSLDIRDFIASQGHYDDGDVIFTNDPYGSGGATTHAPDATYLKPVFWDGELITYLYCFSHSTDVGGKVPGSVSPTNSDVYQEGIRIPPVKLYKKGELNEEFLSLFLANCRVPDDIWGDMRAIIAAMNTAEKRLHEMCGQFGKETILQAMEDVLDYAEKRARKIISQIPDGSYHFHDFLDDDMVSSFPVRLNARMDVKGDTLALDFKGSEPQVKAAFNIPTLGKKHPWITHRIATFLKSQDSDIPFNAGLVRPIELSLPEESVVNPTFPAAFGVRFPTALRANDVLLGTLAKAMPGRIPASGGGEMVPVVLSEPDYTTGKRKVLTLQVVLGGTGGGPDKDGLDARNCELASLQNTPGEMVEQKSDVIIRRYGICPDSGGAGKYRGGTGLWFEFQVQLPECVMTARGMERYKFQPWGINGGMPGKKAQTIVNPGTPKEKSVGRVDALLLEPGDVVRIISAGGGGWGFPWEREPLAVLEDVLNGFVSVEGAEKDYGVVIRDGRIDQEMTVSLRQQMQVTAPKNLEFSFGPQRTEFESVMSEEIWNRILEILYSLPLDARDFIKRKLYAGLMEEAKLHEVSCANVEALWMKIKEEYAISIS